MSKKQTYIDYIDEKLEDFEDNSIFINQFVIFFSEDTDQEIGDELVVDEVYRSEDGDIYARFNGKHEDKLIDDCTEYEVKLIHDAIAEEYDDDWNPDMDTEALISELGITADMDCDKVYDKVHAYIRKPYDGQVGDVLFMDEANEKTEEICKILGIEFVPAK